MTVIKFLGCFLPVNYFVILYSVLYLISPYLNLIFGMLTKKQFSKLVIWLFVLFSVWTIGVDVLCSFRNVQQMSTVGMYGAQGGYTIVNFVLCYTIAAYIRLYDVTFSKRTKAMLFVGCLCVLYGTSFLSASIADSYNNPFVIGIAAIILIIFKDVELNCKPINELAKGAFTSYLFHVRVIGYTFAERAATFRLPLLVIHQIGVAVGLFLVSFVLYKVYHLLSEWFFTLIGPQIDSWDLYSFEE